MLPYGAVAPLLGVPRWERAQCRAGWRLWQLCTPVVATSSRVSSCSPAVNLLKLFGSPA